MPFAVIFLGVALLIVVIASLFTNIKVWGVASQMLSSLRGLPDGQRRRVLLRTMTMYAVIGAYAALLITHPLGLRDTFIWFLIVPFLIVVPIAVVVIAVRAWRRPHGESTARPGAQPTDPRKKRG